MLRLFLLAYPKAFRERHGEEMLRVCSDAYGPGFTLRAAADLLCSGLCERAGAAPASFDEWMERPRHQSRGEHALASWARDFRAGARSLVASRGFSGAIRPTLALGIGASTAT